MEKKTPSKMPLGEFLKDDGNHIRPLRTIVPGTLGPINVKGEWEIIKLAVDSGATETVINEEMLDTIETKEGAQSRQGVMYEVANGVRIPNLGEKRFIGISNEGSVRSITAQVCDVNKALLSVKKMVVAGNRVVFDPEGSYIDDRQSGERMWMTEEDGMYMLTMWVKRETQGLY